MNLVSPLLKAATNCCYPYLENHLPFLSFYAAEYHITVPNFAVISPLPPLPPPAVPVIFKILIAVKSMPVKSVCLTIIPSITFQSKSIITLASFVPVFMIIILTSHVAVPVVLPPVSRILLPAKYTLYLDVAAGSLNVPEN